MEYLRRTTAALTFITLAGCAPEPDGSERTRGNAGESAQESAYLPDEVLDSLRERFPVLGQERAPEPRPRQGASPEDVPARVRSAVGERVLQAATGGATYYADKFEGRRTASGIPFRQNQMVAAHRSFPFGTLLRVTNLGNDRSVNVRVVDRGPFGGSSAGAPMIDLSRRAATELGYISAGRAEVRIEVLEWGNGLPRAS